MVVPNLDERVGRKAVAGNKFFRVPERNHVIGSAVKDDRIRLECSGGTPILPCGAKQYEWRLAGLDIHGDCTTTRGANNHVGLMFVVFSLSRADRFVEVVIIESGVDDLVTCILQVRGFDATNNTMPAMQE